MAESSTFDVIDPATHEVVDQVADAGPEEARAAVDAAAAAFPGWAATAPRARAEVLRAAYELMVRDRDRLAALISAENGKARADAEAEVTYAAEFFRWFSEEAVRSDGDYATAPASGAKTLVTHQPVGVAALVTPWNFPAAMATRKIAPALAAGCTVVLKPAHETPLTAIAVAELLAEAGLPDGVVNVVATTDAASVVTAWLEDERVRKISFTGSTPIGKVLLRQAADRVVTASMELGGNAPFVVTADADLDAAVAGAMIAKFRNGGQSCVAANRFIVEQSIVDSFVVRLLPAVQKLVVGRGLDADVDLGPLVDDKSVRKVQRLVDDALAKGASKLHDSPIRGRLVGPIVLGNITPAMELWREEIFGPVIAIRTARDEHDALAQANDTEYGLVSYVYTRDAARQRWFAEGLESGMVGVNTGLVSTAQAPFGGIKHSGLGREGSRHGIDDYTNLKYVSAQ